MPIRDALKRVLEAEMESLKAANRNKALSEHQFDTPKNNSGATAFADNSSLLKAERERLDDAIKACQQRIAFLSRQIDFLPAHMTAMKVSCAGINQLAGMKNS